MEESHTASDKRDDRVSHGEMVLDRADGVSEEEAMRDNLMAEEAVPALEVGASVALVLNDELEALLRDSDDGERFAIAAGMIDDFAAIDEITGWSREATAGLLGCQNPEPHQWLDVAVSELEHSQSVVHFIREVIDNFGVTSDPSVTIGQIRERAPSLPEAEARSLAERELARAAASLTTDLLRRARGSTFAVRRVLDDGAVLDLVTNDNPGKARLLGYERLRDRAQTTAAVGRAAAACALPLVQLTEDEPVFGVDPETGETTLPSSFPQ